MDKKFFEITELADEYPWRVEIEKAFVIKYMSNNWRKMNHIPMRRKKRNRVIIFPKIVKVDKKILTMKLENVVDGSIKVTKYLGDGELGKEYELGITASDNEFAIKINNKITIIILPKDKEAKWFIIQYKKRQFLSRSLI